MLRLPLALLAGALLLAPLASACSLAGVPPAPGFFQLEAPDGSEQRVEVEGRMLGAGCELSNPHALHGEWFVWVEEFWNPNFYRLHARHLPTGEERVFANVTTGRPEALDVHNGTATLYARAWRSADASDPRELVLVDLKSGEITTRELPRENIQRVALHGGRALLSWGGTLQPVLGTLMLLDVEGDATLRGPDRTETLGLGREVWVVGMGARYALVQGQVDGQGALFRLDLERWTSERSDLDPNKPVLDVDGEHAYLRYLGSDRGANATLLVDRMDLATGENVTLPGESGQNLLGFEDGWTIRGSFFAFAMHGDPLPPTPDVFPTPMPPSSLPTPGTLPPSEERLVSRDVPAPGPLALGALALGLAVARRRR